MKNLDQKLTQLIGQSLNPTILGLLPVETNDQEEILRQITTHLDSQFSRLLQDLVLYPALTTYAVAVAVGKGNTEANFYKAMEKELEINLGLNQRARFAEQFEASCCQLGLVIPESEEENHADRYIRSVIFQAGILPYWVTHLAQAVISYLEKNPCPDLEDEHQVTRFARLLAERVPPGQARLRRTLESSVGPLVCRAILAAFSSGDFDQLPPHLREPMREARKKTGGESIRSPYLRFSPEDGALEVVLPRQSSKLADFNSCWMLGSNTYNALIERTLAVADLPGAKCRISLTGLRKHFLDQVFTVKLAPDEQDPFFVFRAADGRRLPVGLRPAIELPLGDYHVVLPSEIETNEEDSFGRRGQFKAAKIEIFPGRDDLEIFIGERKVALRPRLGSDLLIHDKAGNKLQSLDGVALFYGDGLEVQAFTPVVSYGDSRAMEFKIECPDNPSIKSKICRREEADSRGAYHFYDLSTELVQPFLSDLPSGIHEVQITAEGRARNFSRRLIYWKGFRRTTKNFGFVCNELPKNFDKKTSVGVQMGEKGLQICKDHFGPEVVIGIKHPTRTFKLAKPGIWLRIFDPERLDARRLDLGRSIEVNSNEQLIIESGDTLPWKIRCDHVVLAELKPGQAKHMLNLGALLSQFGESGILMAENDSGLAQTLVLFSKANLARNLTVEATPGAQFYKASFRIGRSQIHKLEVKVSNFATGESAIGNLEMEVAEGEFNIAGFSPQVVKLQITAEETDWIVAVEANLVNLPPGLYFIDFRAKKNGQTRWQPLRVADKHGLSESRLVIRTDPVCAGSEGFWDRLLIRACQKPDLDSDLDNEAALGEIPEKELRGALERIQEALLFKYASPIWPGVQWLETALVRVCQEGYSSLNEGGAEIFADLAVVSLSQKSESSLSIHSTLVFGCQELLAAQRGITFSQIGPADTQIGQVFREIRKIAEAASLKDYVASNFLKGCAHVKLLNYYANSSAVFSTREREFKGFDYSRFFAHLADQSQELDFKQAEVKADLLLTPEHFLTAIRALNRRFRPLEQIRNTNVTGTTLGQMNCEIRAMGNQLDCVAPVVKQPIGLPNYFELSIPIRIAESVMAQSVSDLLLIMTGLGRLTANGLLSREKFLQHMVVLLNPEGESLARRTHRLCLLLSLAPELFGFYMLFWETMLKPLAKS